MKTLTRNLIILLAGLSLSSCSTTGLRLTKTDVSAMAEESLRKMEMNPELVEVRDINIAIAPMVAEDPYLGSSEFSGSPARLERAVRDGLETAVSSRSAQKRYTMNSYAFYEAVGRRAGINYPRDLLDPLLQRKFSEALEKEGAPADYLLTLVFESEYDELSDHVTYYSRCNLVDLSGDAETVVFGDDRFPTEHYRTWYEKILRPFVRFVQTWNDATRRTGTAGRLGFGR